MPHVYLHGNIGKIDLEGNAKIRYRTTEVSRPRTRLLHTTGKTCIGACAAVIGARFWQLFILAVSGSKEMVQTRLA